MSSSFLWHDYETSGADARRDRPAQFAAIRTTPELEPVGEPIDLYCRPAPDVLPHPQAALITGLTPQQLERDGLAEVEFAARVHEAMSVPGTCVVGYNSIRFDDEFTRQLLYRNFYDPYEREWRDGNSRWDLIDLMRICFALRPEGIAWPTREDGSPSFRLEDLAAANRVEQTRAHEALSDVEALIGLARLVRLRQPRLFEYQFALRRKQRVFELLDVARMTPLLHVSSRYPASRGCLAPIAPVAMHPHLPNAVLVVDLHTDPADLIALDAEAIADRVFTPRADLPEGVERIGLKAIHANRSPALAPLSTARGIDTARIGLDLDQAQRHLDLLRAADGLASKVRQVFALTRDAQEAPDPELALYGGFLPDADRALLREVRRTPAAELARHASAFRDPRYAELLFRYRARNWPDTLDADEAARWQAFRRERLLRPTPLTGLTLADYRATIQALRADPAHADRHVLLDALQAWGLTVEAGLAG